jgi:hypothetical protein
MTRFQKLTMACDCAGASALLLAGSLLVVRDSAYGRVPEALAWHWFAILFGLCLAAFALARVVQIALVLRHTPDPRRARLAQASRAAERNRMARA